MSSTFKHSTSTFLLAIAMFVGQAHAQSTPTGQPSAAPDGRDPIARILDSVREQLKGRNGPFTLVVDVQSVSGKMDVVANAYAIHAAKSRIEPGVGPFEIGRDINQPDKLLLYETYADLPAFERHVRAKQTQEFVAASSGIIASRATRLVLDVTRPDGGETPAAPLILEMSRSGEELLLGGIQVRVDEGVNVGVRRVATQDLLRPSVLSYAWANSGSAMVLGLPPGRSMPQQDRAKVLTDDVLNSGLFNISEQRDALVLRFEHGLKNGRGPDLVVAEMGTAVGRPYMDTPAPGGDRFVVTAIADDGHRYEKVINPADYTCFGRLGKISKYGVPDASLPIPTADALDRAPVALVATADNLFLYAVAIDLSDLGVPEGAIVRDISLRAAPRPRNRRANSPADSSANLLNYVDPVLVVGLPPI